MLMREPRPTNSHRPLSRRDVSRCLFQADTIQLVHGQVGEEIDSSVDELSDLPIMINCVLL